MKTLFRAAVAVFGIAGCSSGDADLRRKAALPRETTVVAVPTTPTQPVTSGLVISAEGAGPVRLGMTLDEVRKNVPAAKISRTSDGEGVALVEITILPSASVVAYADEEDARAPIDWTKRIKMIETFSPVIRTGEGVHAGSLVSDVEKIYGKTKSVETSEIESRQYITFDKQPRGLTFRVNYSGNSSDGSDGSKGAKGGSIQSIAVAAER